MRHLSAIAFHQLYSLGVNELHSTYLVEVDGRLPKLLVGLVEVSHTNLTEVTRVVLVKVSTVVVLTTGHTATTGVLAVLANATVTGRHMTAARVEKIPC